MDGGKPAEDGSPEWRSAMLDVSAMSLSALVEASPDEASQQPSDSRLADGPDSAFEHCLRRLADDLIRSGAPIAGFNSTL